MTHTLILASGSTIRAQLLTKARVPFEVQVARIDEESFRAAMEADDISPRDMADHLAEFKAARVADRNPEALVLGCDQVLDFRGRALAKPDSPETAVAQLGFLAGTTHDLHSAIVLFDHGQPVWRHVGRVRMTMRPLSADYIKGYVARNWQEIRHCVGGYQLEEEGARLFSRIDGDFFTVLGLPLLPLLDHLAVRGVIET